MKKLLTLTILLSLLLGGCSLFKKKSGNKSRNAISSNEAGYWKPSPKQKVKRTEVPPEGMVLIPSGNFVMGMSDEDILQTFTGNPKTVTIDAFWMDQTEITNYEYRNFIEYVKERSIRKRLGDEYEEFVVTEDEDGTPLDEIGVNWRAKIDYNDPTVKEILNEFNYSGEEALMGKKEYDVRNLVYDWQEIDWDNAARVVWNPETKSYEGTIINSDGEEVDVENRGSFISKSSTYIYPDTLCWKRDFQYSNNDPLMIDYFYNPAFNDYPVVGVSWKQAEAYCHFRSETEHVKKGEQKHYYRLPTEAEWEYAARGGLAMQTYPWGGPYATNKQGCYLANFKPQRGKFALDGGSRTVAVGSYEPNDYGLYDMAGNVSEWTNNAYDESAYSFYSDLVPTYAYNAKRTDPLTLKRKVVRGGSWNDVAYYLQCGSRTYEYQDECRSYIGFRCVRTYLGSPKRLKR